MYAFSESFIVNPNKFKILMKDRPKSIMVNMKPIKAYPLNNYKSSMKIIEVTNKVGTKNIIKSAKTIPI